MDYSAVHIKIILLSSTVLLLGFSYNLTTTENNLHSLQAHVERLFCLCRLRLWHCWFGHM